MQPEAFAARLAAEVRALPARTTPAIRRARQAASRALRNASAQEVRAAGFALARDPPLRWVGYELIRFHRPAFGSLTDADLEALAHGLDGWGVVDAFGTILAGPAWRAGLASDALIGCWAGSPDRWRRRLALVATVIPARAGDAARTLAVCERLVGDRDDIVEKALSWSLRELAKPDPAAVRDFLARHDAALGARVRREVRHKLATGLKTPRRRSL